MPTSEEVALLKQDWLEDPSWDIEDTQGFEEHKAELKVFRILKEAEWRAKEQELMLRKADQLGCSGNTKLARYVIKLEDRILGLAARIIELENSK